MEQQQEQQQQQQQQQEQQQQWRPPPKGGGMKRPPRKNRRRKDRTRPPRRGPPPTPQQKVTIRNISNVEKYGSVPQICSLIRELISRANEKLLEEQKMQLDDASLQRLILEEQAAQAARAAWEKEQSKENIKEEAKEEEGSDTKEEETKVATEKDDLQKQTADLVAQIQKLQISDSSSKSGIATRALYVVPPKKTRRRGEKPGCAYIVLTAPPIELKPAQTKPVDPNTNADNSAIAVPPPVDYSRDVAKRRFLIARAVEALIHQASEDAKSKQEFAGCVVEESRSGKTWRPPYYGRRDRMEGTIEETPDYQQFLERTQKEKEERLSRPKPAPGGGVASVAAAESEQPMAALVMHIRAKHEQERKRKKAKRKAKDAIKKKKETDVKKNAAKKNKKKKQPPASSGVAKKPMASKPGGG